MSNNIEGGTMDLRKEIKLSYLQLKREVYYDQANLFLREAIARFEKGNFDHLSEISLDINNYLDSPKENSAWLEEQLKSIDCFLLPKRLKKNADDTDKTKKSIINNVRESDSYEVEDIFYYFSGNISLYILSVLWCRLVGRFLDNELSDECFGNRLESHVGKDADLSHFSKLFKTYLRQYQNWRDGAINQGLRLLKDKKNIFIIALDIKQCYYRLETNWDKISEIIEEKGDKNYKKYCKALNLALKKIHEQYHAKTHDMLTKTVFFDESKETHMDLDLPIGLPIGLPSSQILANWELKPLDDLINKNVRPIHYGRYVDDLLIVLNVPKQDPKDLDTRSILKKYFEDSGILIGSNNLGAEAKNNTKDEDIEYRVVGYKHLLIQQEKIIIHYYQHDHSWAGLKEFKEDLRNQSSEFRFLPTDDMHKELSNEAYDLQYEGSINKFRSLIGISENQNKLTQYIYKQQLKAWLCSSKLDSSIIKELFLFYKGKNILNYIRTWERIFTLFLVTNRNKQFYRFEKELVKTISKINFENCVDITQKINVDCKHYLEIAKSMALGYIDQGKINEYSLNDNFLELPKWFRNSLLLRKQNIVWPLLDYSGYKGSLISLNLSDYKDKVLRNVTNDKIEESTRYIHPDEQILLSLLIKVVNIEGEFKKGLPDYPFYSNSEFFLDNKPKDNFKRIREELGFQYKTLETNSIQHRDNHKNPFALELKFPKSKPEEKDQLCVGIANVKVHKNRIMDCMRAKQPLLDNFEKQNNIFQILNEAQRDIKCDLLVFPELFIPFGWLPFMANQSRRLNIGIIFGIEHINIGKYSLNLVATLLPYRDENDFSKLYLSLRLKNYYSPMEAYTLDKLGLERPDFPHVYEKFHWADSVFTVFNCFELTNIFHRGLFRSDIDFLTVVEHNKDVNYYSNLLEAVSRDVHCFAIQANNSEYGDSRIIAPKSTETMNFVRVKGGENPVLLKAYLPIKELRDFQSKYFDPLCKNFKPTPAGFDHEKARQRK